MPRKPKYRCIILMPSSKTSETHTEDYWSKHFETFLKLIIDPIPNIKAYRSEPLRGDILKQDVRELISADVVIADITDFNPNVFWELGVRQSFKHSTITIAEEGTVLPFDISSKSTLFYSPRDHIKNASFTKKLVNTIKDCLKNPDKPDSYILETISDRGSPYEIIKHEKYGNLNLNKTCFVIAPININLDPLKEYLENEFDTKIVDITNIYSFHDLTSEITKEIKKSDFVCAILFGDNLNNVYLEIGIATGSNKPLFLITDDTLKIPEQLKNKVYAFSDSLDIAKIDYTFRAFHEKLIKKQHRKSQRGDRKEVTSDLVLVYKSGLELAHRIKEIISNDLNISMFSMRQTEIKDARYDFSVWSDKLSEYFKNPILIELKKGNSKQVLNNAIKQMKNYLINYNLNLGLIIYSGKKIEIKTDFGTPLILIFEISELEKDLLQNKSITDIIIQRRNKMIHPGSVRYG